MKNKTFGVLWCLIKKTKIKHIGSNENVAMNYWTQKTIPKTLDSENAVGGRGACP